MIELSEQAQAYVNVAVATFADTDEDHVILIATALNENCGPRHMAHVAEAVEYGDLAQLRAIADGDHVNQAFCARAGQVLAWVEESEA